ncbi:MAG: Trk system potassium transporter TrkA [Desulfovibrionales bacterium]|nr:Trk system potassium transporter TrkA [Desulfovibrionales bacterium]
MKAIIIGAGEVGFYVAQRLASEQKDVVVIDRNPAVLQRILDHMDVQVLEGSGCSPLVLGEAGIQKANMLLAVTDSDEINLMACTFANMLAPGLTKLARIRNDEYIAYAEHLSREIGIGIIVNPEVEVVRTIEHMLSAPGAVDISDLAGGRIKLAGTWITEANPLAGTRLMDLRGKVGDRRMIVAAIVRNDKVIVPSGADEIRRGDLVYFVCEDTELQPVFSFLGNRPGRKSNVLIIGGGNIGLRLARSLEKKPLHVKLMDKNPERCTILANELGRTVVLNGDGTDQEALQEENIGQMDVIVTMTGNEESNILSSLLAKKLGTPMAITRLNKIAYMPLVRAIGLEHIVSPRMSAVNSIFKHVRKGGVLSTVAIKDQAEAMEALVSQDSSLVGQPLKDLNFPMGVLVLCIMRQDSVLIPSGNDVILSGDRFIILSLTESIPDVERMLSRVRGRS